MESIPVMMIQSFDPIRNSEGQGSIIRIRKGCDLLRGGIVPERVLIPWPQGYSKKSPTKPLVGGDQSLGENMAEYCARQPEMIRAKAQIHWEPRSWGTKNDLLAAYEMTKKGMWGTPTAHFFFVSDPTHMRRVKLVWDMTHPKGWTASFHPTDQEVLHGFDRTFREWVAYAWYVVSLVPHYLRRK